MANKRKNKQLKNAYFELFEAVSGILFKANPVGIASGDENPNEYDAEAGKIAARLRDCKSEKDVMIVVHETFCDMFDKKIAGPRAKYDKLAGEIWRAYQQFWD